MTFKHLASENDVDIDRDVQKFLQGDQNQRPLSVIVEARINQKATAPFTTIGTPLPRFSALGSRAHKRSEVVNPSLNEIGALLGNFDTPKPAVRLEAAEAYVAALSPKQIREIAANPAVGAIRLNREHFIGTEPR